jgi:cupin superfamily acireductone dioxygenase involved in methionine salvage
MIDINLIDLGYSDLYVWQDSSGTYYDWHTHSEDEVRYILEGS